MTTTDRKVLDELLVESRLQLAPEMEEDDFFEFFAAQQVLREQQLDTDEIRSGNTGGDKSGSDGGIDAFYLLVNGRLIRDTTEAEGLRSLKQNVQIDLIILQAIGASADMGSGGGSSEERFLTFVGRPFAGAQGKEKVGLLRSE